MKFYMMKRLLMIPLVALLLTSCGILRAGFDQERLGQAAAAAITAAAITDEDIVALSKQTIAQLDAEYSLAPASYQNRLSGLLSQVKDVEGMTINYKVYKTEEVNAFACGDGSIRVYSGLMDVMDDSELMAIIGHECGHVVHQDTKHAMKNAYLAYAARSAIGASKGAIGALSRSVLGDLGEAFIGSQYSQKQEYAADEYGYKFSTEYGYSPYSMCNALEKLVDLAGGSQASLVQKMFSSHPDSAERAKRMRMKADLATHGKEDK